MANQSSTPFDQGLFLVHLNRGREHFDARSFVDAAEELEEARRLRPKDETVLNLLGLAYFKQEKFKEADAVYRTLIELNPESSTLYFNLGLVCFKNGELDRAEATFLRALELKPDNQKSHFYLGNIYERKRQYYNAIFQYRKAGANIMVKRVQEKIDRERPAERDVSEDFTVPTPAPDDTRPTRLPAAAPAEPASNEDLLKINVDHLDRKRFLTAIQEGLFPGKSAPTGDTEPTTSNLPDSEEGTLPPSAAEGMAERPKKSTADTQETVLSPEERRAFSAQVASSLDAPGEETIPPPRPKGRDDTTRLRLSEPIIQDESLAEMARSKVPSSPSSELFYRKGAREEPGGSRVVPSPAGSTEPGRSRSSEWAPAPSGLAWSDGGGAEPHVYARGRRRDDLFRYLENNLMEVNFSGKVFIKQGTIYSYSGNLTFWVKPQRDESVPPLVIVSGTGKLLLTDRQREISVLQIESERIFVEPSHLLACQDTLTPRFAVVEREGGGKGLHVLLIEGTGMLALSVATSPLVLPVSKHYPVNVASSSLISWSGDLTPTIVDDEALAEIMMPGDARGINLRLEGEGRVMMEKMAR